MEITDLEMLVLADIVYERFYKDDVSTQYLIEILDDNHKFQTPLRKARWEAVSETMKKVDVDGLKNRLAVAKIEKEVLKAELEGRSTESVLAKLKKENSSLSADDIRYINELKSAKETEYTEKAETLKVVITQRESEHQMAVTNQTRLEQKVKDLTEENESLKYLYGLGSIAKRKWKDKEQELYSTQKEYEAQQAAVIQAKDKIEEAKRNLASIEKEKNTGILNLIVEKEKLINETESSLSKAEKSYEFQRVVSPVDGTINGLSAHTIGGIVTPSQPILTIVPDDTPIIVEANVTNQDIGFIRVGQEVEIKMDTFPFQKYGTINGLVTAISPDAFEDEKIGLIYKIKIEPEREYIMANGKKVNLTAGMSLSAEVKTGKRTIMEFFLSPVLVSMDESLKLR